MCRWLWMHNGLLRDFAAVKRDLALAVDPELYPEIEGSTDSDVVISGGRDELRPFAPRPESAPGRAGVTATRT